MSDFVEKVLKLHNYRNGVGKVQASLQKTAKPIRLGVLSAASISFTSIYDPVSTHPDVIITGLAARSRAKAEAHVARYKLGAKVYDLYDDLLADPDIDAVYIPLPNGLHAKWVLRALEKGKHVLVEKPIANNAEEVDDIIDAAREARKVVLEAYHWRFHPACHTALSLVSDTERYGVVESVKAKFWLPSGFLKPDNIRFDYELGGGSCMDFCYVFSGTCVFAVGGNADALSRAKVAVKSANPRINGRDARVDESMQAQFTLELPATDSSPAHIVNCEVDADMYVPKIWGIVPQYWTMTPWLVIEMSKARIEFNGYIGPWLSHNITIQNKDDMGTPIGKKMSTKALAGGPAWANVSAAAGTSSNQVIGQSWWTTYRYQLEGFVNQIRKVEAGADPTADVLGPWVPLNESRKVMDVIDQVYAKAGLPKRGLPQT